MVLDLAIPAHLQIAFAKVAGLRPAGLDQAGLVARSRAGGHAPRLCGGVSSAYRRQAWAAWFIGSLARSTLVNMRGV